MILQALSSYYDRLALSGNGKIAAEGFSNERIHFSLVIDKTGKLVQVLDLKESKGKKKIPRSVIVTQVVKKSVNIAANFLWGNTTYVLGADDKAKPDRTADCHEAFKELHRKLLAGSDDEGAKAVLAFLSSWRPENAQALTDWPDMLKSNLVFQLDGDMEFIHERPSMKNIWITNLSVDEKGMAGICLVSGNRAPIARLHPAIKGVKGAQSFGAAIVSFNLDAFCSYGKDQNFNAPVGESVAFAYTTALNHLLRFDSLQKIQIGDATTVFWTERDSPVEGFMGMILDPKDDAADNADVRKFLEAVRDGKHPAEIDSDVKFYVLGLSPNAARISVRFWHICFVGDIEKRIGQHFRDLQIIRRYENDTEYPGIWQLLKETALKTENISPLLAGAVMRSILEGTAYPESLLSAVLNRIRADQNINYLRAAILKAILNRKYRIYKQGMEVSIMLDKENKNPAYLLGRLFAVLEKAQTDALGNINATIKDRFWGSVSATPKIVFPQLLKLAQSHIGKAAEYGKIRDKQIEEIICDIKEFPAHFSLDEQGVFTIGYYHQRQDFFKKKESNQ